MRGDLGYLPGDQAVGDAKELVLLLQPGLIELPETGADGPTTSECPSSNFVTDCAGVTSGTSPGARRRISVEEVGDRARRRRA